MNGRDEVLKQLSAALAPSVDDIEQQARSVLGLVIDRIVSNSYPPGEVCVADPRNCPNCDVPTSSTRTPYCGFECREIAGFARQVRSGLADGSILDADRQVAFGQILWHLLDGGRPLRVHIAPEKSKVQAIARNGGLCVVCGAPAVTVDHIGSACNRSINLRGVCEACCRTRPFLDASVLDSQPARQLLEEVTQRIGALTALRPCDDAESWDWRAYLAQRQALLVAR